MCGICGVVSPAGVTSNKIGQMLDAIVHRGPDDEGVHVGDRAGLGSRRLSIIDVPGGRQPLSNEDGTVWVTYNGEIYNYRELRAELQQRGHHFRTGTDTEVLVHLYEEDGERCVERLKGMFAFAIWDARARKLTLARDHLGQKPMFYTQDGEDFRFASEVKALLAVDERAREIDYSALHHYLTLRFIPAPHTMLRHIRKLPPAHVLVYEDGQVTVSRYWRLSFRDKLALNDEAYREGLREKLQQTVRAHMVSDVPVGALLSGGMDSSMVVAMMAQEEGADFDTFAIGVEAQDFNELPYARQVAEHVGSRHLEECVQADVIKLLPAMVWHLDEPSDPIAACQFHAARLASSRVKVVLGGDGGDELFAGFDRYLGIGYVDLYAMLPAALRGQVLGPLIGRLPDRFSYKNVTQKIRWMHTLSMMPGASARYAAATSFSRFAHEDKQQLFGDVWWRQVSHLQSAEVITGHFDEAPADNMLDRMLYADYMTRLPEHSLMLVDRMSMAHGLEARSPFVDHELVSYIASFPADQKIRNRQLKFVLRQLASDYLPPEIVNREKQGFMFPIAYWFHSELHMFLRRFLLDSHVVRSGLFREEMVLQMLDEHRSRRVDHHVRLWMLLTVAVWHALYIEQESLADLTARVSNLADRSWQQ